MPTPDTETLAARLRAVERALTDDNTVLDPPSDGVAESEPEPAVASGASGQESEVADRLCRLEAAVQALHAALEKHDSTSESSPPSAEQSNTDAHRPDRTTGTTGTAVEGVMDIPRDPPDSTHDSREPSAMGWPDDLAAE